MNEQVIKLSDGVELSEAQVREYLAIKFPELNDYCNCTSKQTATKALCDAFYLIASHKDTDSVTPEERGECANLLRIPAAMAQLVFAPA